MSPCSRLWILAGPLIEKALSMPFSAVLLLLSGVGSVGFALTMQWGFNVPPCDLCIWQRYPYGVVAAVSLLCLSWRPYRRQTVILLGLCAITYLVSTGFAIVHTGVERHWWESPLTCMGPSLQGSSLEELRQALLQTKDVPCDEIPWAIFGLSMANLNVAGSLALAFFAAAAATTYSRDRKKD